MFFFLLSAQSAQNGEVANGSFKALCGMLLGLPGRILIVALAQSPLVCSNSCSLCGKRSKFEGFLLCAVAEEVAHLLGGECEDATFEDGRLI